MSEDSNESVHILKVKEKGIEEKEDTDGYEHAVSTGEYFLRGKYLKIDLGQPGITNSVFYMEMYFVHWKKYLKSFLIFRTT